MPGTLKVEVDEPGRRLVLSSDVPEMPRSLAALARGGVVLVCGMPLMAALLGHRYFGGSTSRLADLGVASLGVLLGLALQAILARGNRVVTRVAADRILQRIEITDRGFLGTGNVSTQIVPFAEVRGLSLRASRPAPVTWVGRSPTDLTVTVTLLFQEETGLPPRRLTLAVETLDRKEEGGDLALRLASVVGLDYQRLVSNDPRGIEMQFGTTGGPGFTPLVQTTVPADYARDEVAEAAQVVAELAKTPGFDPASFKGDHSVTTWEPPAEIRFHRPMTFAAIGCAPFVLPLFLGPWALVSAFLAPASGLLRADALVTGSFFAVLGVAVGVVALFIISISVPRDVIFDGSARRLRFKNLVFESGHDFSRIRSLELVCDRTRKPRTPSSYYCRMVANVAAAGAESKAIDLLTTTSYDDPETPYAMGLSLLTDLSAATGLSKVVTDFT
jgi:hypothetical protein